MKSAALLLALSLGSAAFAQTGPAYEGDGLATAAFETEGRSAQWAAPGTAGGAIVQPSNFSPERDARGIAVVSDPAVVPAGWNGVAAGSAMGGPELDPATGEATASGYPPCTRTRTDRCLQTYERGRGR